MPFVLHCKHCGHQRRVSNQHTLLLLQSHGMLRRAANPEPAMLLELLHSISATLPCDGCGQAGVEIQDDWSDEWSLEVRCEACQSVIPVERLEVFPTAKFCSACQAKSEAGGRPDEQAEYCSHCGGIMQLGQRRGRGLAGYSMACTDCGRKA